MSVVHIQFGVKFCQTDLDEIISSYWNSSLDIECKEVVFDLSITEWISTEEIAFLFGWIRTIHQLKKNVTVFLPFCYNINTSTLYNQEKLNALRQKFSFEENEERIKRRKNRNLFLLSIWGMLTRVGLNDTQFRNIVSGYNSKDDAVKTKYSHQVIPFTVIDSVNHSGELQFDQQYEDVLEGSKIKNTTKQEGLFDLESEIVSKLKRYSCYSPFESKIISNVITQELYANASQHSKAKEEKGFEDECYFTSSLSNKWDNANTPKFSEQFINEKYPDTLDFYKDKDAIKDKINLELGKLSKGALAKFKKKRLANLDNYTSDFKNKSYLEFTFLDFGVGIFSTLEEEFKKADKDNLKQELSVNYHDRHLHSQILEYAFLMDSSRIPFDHNIDDYNLIARGLYFLIDMVRRFNGLIVARSGYGKIVYDFSEKIYLDKNASKINASIEPVYEIRDSVKPLTVNTEKSFFPGTMISIVLPEKKKEELRLSPVRINNKNLSEYIYQTQTGKVDQENHPLKEFSTQKFEYISLVFLYETVINSIGYDDLTSSKVIYNKLLAEFVKKLNSFKSKNCLIFIDFGFLPMRHIFLKFLYYLTNTPKINEYTKAIIFNLDDDEEKIIAVCKTNLRSKNNQPFIYRPIPCLKINSSKSIRNHALSINWIGVREQDDEIWLTKMLIGDEDSYDQSKFRKSDSVEGNIFVRADGRVYSLFTDLNDLKSAFEKAREASIEEFLVGLIEDGENPLNEDKGKYIFLTSKGSYQSKYLSLYESLHNKYLAKFFGKYLLDKYIDRAKNDQEEIDFGKLKFEKIITVTVSSQLIGVAIRDLIKEDATYSFLRTDTQNKVSGNYPELIILSSYYSFDTEKPFRKIALDDRVILVNDVISTGSLVYRLVESLNDRGAKIQAVMSIADSRIKDNELIYANEVRSKFDEEYEVDKFITLISHSEKFQLRKYSEMSGYAKGLNPEYAIRRINPLLNTVVELSYNHSEKDRILYSEPQELLRESEFKDEYFKVGHFQQNLTHNGYLTDMANLFQNEGGLKVLDKMRDAIGSKIYQMNLSSAETIRTSILNAKMNLDRIPIKDLHKSEFIARIQQSNIALDQLLNELNESDNFALEAEINDITPISYSKKYLPDFIFYPIQSGIEHVTHKTFHQVFGTDMDNIIGMQRFDTGKGWRFPFPPKRFNKITKGKHILIIDSGSLTGDSLIQMIDSISFLEVGRIDVLSIVGRIEDFYREFYSRLRSLKVKHLKALDEDDSKKNFPVIIDANILFGVNLHIPVFPSAVSCPFCLEIARLESYIDKFSGKHLPPYTQRYIKKRLDEEIKQQNLLVGEKYITPSYLPTLNDNPDFISIFLMRDKLGKIDSYRFYPQYFKDFDKIVNDAGQDILQDITKEEKKEVLKNFELILICILHEPTLFEVHRDLLINVYRIEREILEALIFKKQIRLNIFNYKWSKYSFIRLAAIYWGKNLYDLKLFVALFEFALDDIDALNYLSFLLWEGFFNLQKNDLIKDKTTALLSQMSDELDKKREDNTIYSNAKVREIVKSIIHSFENTAVNNVNDAFFNLRKFFFTQSSDNSHSELKRIIFRITSIIENKDLSEDELNDLFDLSTNIRKTLKTSLLDNLIAIRNDAYLRKCDELQYNNLFKSDSVYSSLTKLIALQEEIISDRKKIIESKNIGKLKLFVKDLDRFQVDYLLEGNDFANYCKKYKCDLKKCIDSALRTNRVVEEIKKRTNLTIKDFTKDNLFVNGHSDLFTHAFEEIFFNAAHCKSNDGGTIDFVINTPEEKPSIELKIIQDRPFVENERINGIEKIILPIFKAFCGEDGIYLNKSSKNYEIKIIFNVFDLKNN